MTRDEAVAAYTRLDTRNHTSLAQDIVDFLIEIDVFAPDEPKSIEDEVSGALRNAGYAPFSARKVCDILAEVGFKIVRA